MRNKFYFVIFLLLLPLMGAKAHFIIADDKHHDLVKEALDKYSDGDLDGALELSKHLDHKTHRDAIKWLVLMEAKDDSEIKSLIDFYSQNSSWPFRSTTRKRIEQAFSDKTDPKIIVKWFKSNPPVTTRGQKMYLKVLTKSSPGDPEISKLVKSIWHESLLTETEERLFERKYGDHLLQEDHVIRIDNLIWDKKYPDARKLLRHLDSDLVHLFNARLAYIEDKIGKELLLKLVPRKLKSDQGLSYALLLRYSEEDDHKSFNDSLAKIGNIQDMKKQDRWCCLINQQVRNLLEEGYNLEAYNLSIKACRNNASREADAEWLSGWIALRSLHNPKLAIKHFTKLSNTVKLPISLSRAYYWLARSYQDSGDEDEAKQWYQKAGDFPFTFYGQLALEELGQKYHQNFFNHKLPDFSESELQILSSNNNLNIAYIISQTKWYQLAHVIVNNELEAANSQHTKHLIVAAGKLFGQMDLSLVAAKKAMYHNIVDYEAAYPYYNESFMKHPVLVNSLTRQESLFNNHAVSGAGAKGLMQLMPKTASISAKQIGVKFDEERLLKDPKYNLRLGSNHIDDLYNMFGSNIMAIAAYNAGETPIRKWVQRFGDPRKTKSIYDVIDWIEKIPYSETRNYVQRVIENMQIYHSIVSNKKDLNVSISHDLFE